MIDEYEESLEVLLTGGIIKYTVAFNKKNDLILVPAEMLLKKY